MIKERKTFTKKGKCYKGGEVAEDKFYSYFVDEVWALSKEIVAKY